MKDFNPILKKYLADNYNLPGPIDIAQVYGDFNMVTCNPFPETEDLFYKENNNSGTYLYEAILGKDNEVIRIILRVGSCIDKLATRKRNGEMMRGGGTGPKGRTYSGRISAQMSKAAPRSTNDRIQKLLMPYASSRHSDSVKCLIKFIPTPTEIAEEVQKEVIKLHRNVYGHKPIGNLVIN